MKEHNKVTLVREYCLARKIPYKLVGEHLYLGSMKTDGRVVSFFSVYNFPWNELLGAIDAHVEYNEFGDYVRIIP